MAQEAYVIGTTPEGYAAVLALLTKKFSVTLIRGEGTPHVNQHRLFIAPETIEAFYSLTRLALLGVELDINTRFKLTLTVPNQDQLDSMTDEDRLDFKFLKELEQSRCLVPTYKLQEYQEQKLGYIMKNRGYKYYSGTTKLLEVKFLEGQELLIKGECCVQDVDGDSKKIALMKNNTKEEDPIWHHFDVLVDATGPDHEITSMIGKNNAKFKIGYNLLDKPRHNVLGEIALKVANPSLILEDNPISIPPFVGTTLLMSQDLLLLKELGWDQDYLPICFLNYRSENQEIYFTGEVPGSFLDSDNKNKQLENWATEIINIVYCRDKDLRYKDLYSFEKTKMFISDKLLLSVTSLCSVSSQSPQYADDNAILLPKGGVFFIVGSAFIRQYPLLNNELRSALHDVSYIPPCIDELGKVDDSYISFYSHNNPKDFISLYSMRVRSGKAVKEYNDDLKFFLEKQQKPALEHSVLTKTAFVIGMGLAGITAAYLLLSRGFSVTLIDKRNKKKVYTRAQGIFMKKKLIERLFGFTKLALFGVELKVDDKFTLTLTDLNQEQLNSMMDEDRMDFAFFKEVEQSSSVVPIYQIQKYQEKKLRYSMKNRGYKRYDGTKLVKDIKFSERQVLSINKGDYSVDAVDGEKQTIVLLKNNTKEKIPFHFDVLVDATGPCHEITSMIRKNNDKFKIDYKSFDKPRHNAFCVVILKVENSLQTLENNPISAPAVDAISLTKEDLPILKRLGWEINRPPLIAIKYTAKSKEIYFTGEVPSFFLDFNDNKKREVLKKWATAIVTIMYVRDNGLSNLNDVKEYAEKLFPSATSLCSVFSQSPKHADKIAVKLPNGGVFCIIGDAFLPANFLSGEGFESAVSDAKELVGCFGVDGKLTSLSSMLKYGNERVKQYSEWSLGHEQFLKEQCVETSSQVTSQQFFLPAQDTTNDGTCGQKLNTSQSTISDSNNKSKLGQFQKNP